MKKLLFFTIISILFIYLLKNNYNVNDIQIAGSSTVYPITLEAEYKFMKTNPQARINVEANGTGGGFELFTKGITQINNASRKITNEEQEVAQNNNVKYTEYLIGRDGITIIVNQDNDWIDNITKTELQEIFETNSPIKTWSDLKQTWPNKEIHLYGPTSASGTYDFFCDTIVKQEGEQSCSLTNSMNATENDNEIITNVSRDKYGIGFLGYAYYHENQDKVKSLAINNIPVNEQTIKSNQYLISRPLYLYVNNEDMQNNETLNKFIHFYLFNSQDFVKLSGYIPLTDTEIKNQEKKLI